MRNTELLESNHPNALLDPLDQQRRYLLKMANLKMPCPNCGTKQNEFEAAGVSIDEFHVDNSNDHVYHCVNCKREMRHVIPFISDAPWYWTLVPEQEQKAS